MAIARASLRFPSAYAQMLINIAEVYHLPVELLLQRYGLVLPEGWETRPDVFIDGDQFAAMLAGLEEFIAQGGPTAQAKVLEFFPLTIHGYVGLAAMTAATLQQALDVGVTYFHQVMPAYDTGYHLDGERCIFSAEPISDFREHNALLAETTVCAMNSVLAFSELGFEEVTVTFQHDHLVMTELANFYPGMTIETGNAHNTVSFPATALTSPLLTGNAATFRMMENELARRERFLATQQTLVYRVFQLIKARLADGREVDARMLAHDLHLSVRTFSRRLQEAGTSFKAIHDQCRLELASHLLRNTDKPMVLVSAELGFVNESSFSRYIKQKIGLGPLQYRKQAQAGTG